MRNTKHYKLATYPLLIIATFFFILQAFAENEKAVEIPSRVDRDKVSASFKFAVTETTFTGTKREYSFELTPNGILILSSVYYDNTRFACSNQGGVVSSQLSVDQHSQYMVNALKAIKDSEKEQNALNNRRYRPDNPPSTLNVEYDNNYYSAILDPKSKQESVKKFFNLAQTAIQALVKDKNAINQSLSLFEKRDYKSRDIELKLSNSGNQTLRIALPPLAQQHFLLRNGTGGVTPLMYKSLPPQMKFELTPGQSVKLELLIPKEVEPASGLTIYDNSPEITGDNNLPNFNNSIFVSLCPILPNNSHAELK